MNNEVKRDTIDFLKNLLLEQGTKKSEDTKSKNIAIWCGAGFSKSWNQNSPTDGDLFQMDRSEFSQFPNLCRVLNALSWGDNDKIGFEGFKTLSYLIGMMIRYPDIRNQYLDSHTLEMSIGELRYYIESKFSKQCAYQKIENRKMRFIVPETTLEAQKSVLDFFDTIINKNTNTKIDFVSTNYDNTIEAILDNIQPSNGPIVPTLYRGVTPKFICGEDCFGNPNVEYNHTLIKLNGGFEILREGKNYHFMYGDRQEKDKRDRPPILILPNREQDYSDSYFSEIFPKAVRLLREADILMIVGYSMPWEDVLLRFVLHQFAESDGEAIGKHIFCVDLKGPEILRSRLLWTFGSIKSSGWPKVQFYPGAFVEFCEEFGYR